jgi:hypothetical protein
MTRDGGGDARHTLRLVPKSLHRAWDLHESDAAAAYEVAGLPPDLAVEIAEMHGCWQLLVVRDGMRGEWQGDFESADAALAAIERELGRIDARSPRRAP